MRWGIHNENPINKTLVNHLQKLETSINPSIKTNKKRDSGRESSQYECLGSQKERES